MRKIDKRIRRRRMKRRVQLYTRVGVFVLAVLLAGFFLLRFLNIGPFERTAKQTYGEQDTSAMSIEEPVLDVQLLTVNEYSRPGLLSDKITGIVIHYTANPGSTAQQNRDYFENLKDTHTTMASSHFIVGIEGEIIQCVPTWEYAYASNTRNHDTVSIETCHLSEDGSYTEETYQSLVHLTAWLCEKFELTEQDVIRHYDVTGKICPKYFVEEEDAWEHFKADVKKVLEES